jgi:hypothetical protein
MFQSPALYQPPAVGNKAKKHIAMKDAENLNSMIGYLI